MNGTAKAYPVDALVKTGLVNDEIAGHPVVVVWEPGADAKNRTLRAYDRGDRNFSRSERAFLGAVFLNDQHGRPWPVQEDALTTPDGNKLLGCQAISPPEKAGPRRIRGRWSMKQRRQPSDLGRTQ